MPKDAKLPYFDNYLLYLQTNNYSEETIDNYERDLIVFEGFLKEGSVPFKSLKRRDIEQYKAYLTSRDRKTAKMGLNKGLLGAKSINRTLSALRSYLKYLIDMDYETPVVPENIKFLKTEKKVAKVAEFEDLIRLIESPTKFESNPLMCKTIHS